MVIAGDIDFEQAKEMVEKYFTEIPAKAEVAKIDPIPAVLDNPIKLMHEDNFAQLPELNLVWPGVEDAHADMYALDYLGQLLSEGKRAPLFKEVVEGQKLAPATSSYHNASEISGVFRMRIRAPRNAFRCSVSLECHGGRATDRARGLHRLPTPDELRMP